MPVGLRAAQGSALADQVDEPCVHEAVLVGGGLGDGGWGGRSPVREKSTS